MSVPGACTGTADRLPEGGPHNEPDERRLSLISFGFTTYKVFQASRQGAPLAMFEDGSPHCTLVVLRAAALHVYA